MGQLEGDQSVANGEVARLKREDMTGNTKYGTRQHRVPAALIGRFGEPDASGKRRRARVKVRDRWTGLCRGPVSAQSVFHERGAFDGDSPGFTVDDLWSETELLLPEAADDLEGQARHALEDTNDVARLGAAAEAARVILGYAAEVTHRHAGFDAVLLQQGSTRDEVQAQRAESVQSRRRRWRDELEYEMTVLVAPEPAGVGLLVHDWGWTRLRGEVDGALVPLGRYLAVVVHFGARQDAGLAVGVLDYSILQHARDATVRASTPAGVPEPRFVAGHPSDPDLQTTDAG